MTRRILITLLLSLLAAACVPIRPQGEDLGAVIVGPGEPIQLRSLSALSFVADLGVPSQRGAALAVADYGPIHGHPLALVGYDTRCSDTAAAAAADAVVGDPRVIGVIGASCSFASMTAAPIISQAGLVMISPSNTAPSLTSDLRGNPGEYNRPGYFRVVGNDLYEAQAVAQFAYQDLGLRKIAAIHDGDPYTSGLVFACAAAFEEMGGAMSIFSVSKGQTDMRSLLAEIAALSPDAVYMPLFPAEGGRILQQIHQLDDLSAAVRIGGAGLLTAEFLTIPESEGIYLPGPELEFDANRNQATGRGGQELTRLYRETYQEENTSPYMFHAYDAATLLLQAIEEVAVVDGDALYVDRAALRAALSNTSNFSGVTGSLSCDRFGDCGAGRVRISHHTDASVSDPVALPVVYRYAP